ncbi:MAG: DUF58 domain-containing protein [Myxococcota bacterium]
MNFARLNHIFVPRRKDQRDRLRGSWIGKLSRPGVWLFSALTDEGRALVVLTVLIGLVGLDITSTQVHILFATLAGLMAGSFLLRPAFRLRGVELELQSPRRVAVGQPLRIQLTVVNRDGRPHHALRLAGPFLPWDGHYASQPARVSEIAPGERIQRETQATFVERGDHHLDPFLVSAALPFGLTMGPRLMSDGLKFRVVPHPRPIAHLTVPEGRGGSTAGELDSTGRGAEAFELVGVRPYRRGDPIRDLHHRTWARLGVPHVREYRQRRQRNTALIVDAGSDNERAFEAMMSLAAGIAQYLVRERLDVLVVGDTLHELERGRSALDHVLDILALVSMQREAAVFDAKTLEPVPDLSTAVIVSAARDERLHSGFELLQRSGIAFSAFRVDAPPWWRRTGVSPVAPRHRDERVIEASTIEQRGELRL